MPSELPSQLAYLAPAIAQLQQFDPESLGDDNPDALNVVESAVRSRVRGMDESQAKAAIEEDCTALGQWLEQPGLENSTAHFIYGSMFGLIMWADFGELAS